MPRWSPFRKAVRRAAELEHSTRPGAQPSGRGRRAVRAARTATRALQRRLSYAPQRDGAADPGEIVWTSVPYEDQPHVVKDRPVLVVGRTDSGTVLALMLSSQAHRDGDRGWLALGAGDWDAERRPSFVRLDRVLELADDSIRREGAVLDRARFERVSAALKARGDWS